MSMNLDYVHHLPPPHQSQLRLEVEPISIVCARSIAHKEMSPTLRAHHAAAWVEGRSLLRPTIKLAGEVYDVSYPLIARALATPGWWPPSSSMPLGMLAWGWLKSSERERAAFCDEYEADIWHSLEHANDAR
ncbi:MAG TPA: hypothetical protein VI077_03155 [Pseudolabrys sp.]